MPQKQFTELERLRADNAALKDSEARTYSKLRALEKELAAIRRENATAASIREEIYKLAAVTPDPPKWIARTSTKGSGLIIPMMNWSDWHWGEVVEAEQVGGVNEYNRRIARTRLDRLVNRSHDLIRRQLGGAPKAPGIVVCLGGDMISGGIHEELRETNDGSIQQCLLELQERLESVFAFLADEFSRVFIVCVPGNHARGTIKPRAKNRVFESYEWNLYCQLERYFRRDDRIGFLIPADGDGYFTVLGHRFLLTHGDTLGVKGGDGIIGALGPITRGAIKVGRNQAQIGRDFDTVVMGHWHIYVPRGDATAAMCNSSMIGYNEYAHTILRVPFARPSQSLWFLHERHGIVSQEAVYLEEVSVKTSREWVGWSREIRG